MKRRKSLTNILPPEQVRAEHQLKERINQLGICQADVAFAIGCSEPELSRWLNNRRAMPSTIADQIEEVLDLVEGDQ